MAKNKAFWNCQSSRSKFVVCQSTELKSTETK